MSLITPRSAAVPWATLAGSATAGMDANARATKHRPSSYAVGLEQLWCGLVKLLADSGRKFLRRITDCGLALFTPYRRPQAFRGTRRSRPIQPLTAVGVSAAALPQTASTYQHHQDTHTNNPPKPLPKLESTYFYKKCTGLCKLTVQLGDARHEPPETGPFVTDCTWPQMPSRSSLMNKAHARNTCAKHKNDNRTL
jgi:hypothetical protein